MKKLILGLGGTLAVFALLFAFTAMADVNAVTPSTNDINRTNGWAHVNQLSKSVGETDLQFVSTRGFWSCFEYRADNEPNTVAGSNPNPDITDGRWTQVCVNNSTTEKTIQADEYVEVRMVYGAEKDERFDWTRFDVEFERTAEITSPTSGQLVSGVVSFDATLNDKDGDDGVQWAVRQGTCAAGTGTVFGNVDGFSDDYDWDNETFHATTGTTAWADGSYCFVFNPTESGGDTPIRLTREFVVDNTAPAMPTGLKRIAPDEGNKIYNCGDVSKIQRMWPDWDDNTESDFDRYEYSSFNVGGIQGIDEQVFTESVFQYSGSWLPGEGTYGFAVRAVDEAGNKSDWALSSETLEGSCQITYDNTAPEKVTGMTIWQNGDPIGCGATVEERRITVKWTASNDPNFSHYEYQADKDMQDPIDFTTKVNNPERTGDIRDEDGTYYYRVRAIDRAGNVGEYSDWCHINLDRDGDGIFSNDMCSDTKEENVAKLNPNHFAWLDDSMFDFTMGVNEKAKGKANGPDKSFNLEDTLGCNCQQIIDWLGYNYPEEYGEMLGHEKHGCSISVMEAFMNLTKVEE